MLVRKNGCCRDKVAASNRGLRLLHMPLIYIRTHIIDCAKLLIMRKKWCNKIS